jgi:hypothetical protein
MITLLSKVPKSNLGSFLLGKYAIFKSKNQVSLFWVEEAKIVSVSEKAINCIHPPKSEVYDLGTGRYRDAKPIRHRFSSLIAVSDSVSDINTLSDINVLYVKNHVLAQVIFMHNCTNPKELKQTLKAYETMLLKLT